ncbi:exosortase P [Kutzneria viridogrisea]|uniref:Exosortase/archaeosortase family protein n=2 Tax=Kutzneria viridogrisea TaxID=47990 RepID=A0ABR6BTX8_9PSEU|nr:exosortase/archaeosortase family protein [Kutzneria viridogrisea]
MTAVHPLPMPANRGVARVLVLLLAALAVALVLGHRIYRTAEIALAGGVISLVTSSGVRVVPDRQTVYFGLTTDTPLGLQMTPECTSAFLLVPLIVVAAVMIALRPRIARRVLFSLGVAALALVVVNQLRILTLVGLVNWLGIDQGYYLGHTLLGSMVSVIGGAAALVLFVWLATRGPKSERAA